MTESRTLVALRCFRPRPAGTGLAIVGSLVTRAGGGKPTWNCDDLRKGPGGPSRWVHQFSATAASRRTKPPNETWSAAARRGEAGTRPLGVISYSQSGATICGGSHVASS